MVTGSNIISSRDDEWRRYRTVIKPGLQTYFDTEPLFKHAEMLTDILCPLLKSSYATGILVQGILQRYSSANLLHSVFGCTHLSVCRDSTTNCLIHVIFHFSQLIKYGQSRLMSMDHEEPLHSAQLELKRYLFRPLYMNFPALDRLASIIPSRVKARKLIREFRTSLEDEIAKEHASFSGMSSETSSLCDRIINARRVGLFSRKEFRDNLTVLYVAGQENPQLLMISSLYLLGKYPVRV